MLGFTIGVLRNLISQLFSKFESKLNNMELMELKAKAYDILSNLEYLQKQLQEVNQLIAKKIQEEKTD